MKKQIEIQNRNVKTLPDLIKDNPDLRIMPMVESEIVISDDFSSLLGSFGITENESILKSHDEEELVQDVLDDIPAEINDKIADKTATEAVKNYEWEKANIVASGGKADRWRLQSWDICS
ncbi:MULTISPECIES: hypothetical protein [Enterococcus]|uniref:Uncharacterized protein n=1 Tax=Candidatus Enterococcus murrayae TaxID=2815321 RepID=A0ABS3HER3_9ENTE|nr:hypothetical protein [Enterococcus sp. MJM16]MBO0451946.1 hypothetical protein [Enterococcus sp. MJM16]